MKLNTEVHRGIQNWLQLRTPGLLTPLPPPFLGQLLPRAPSQTRNSLAHDHLAPLCSTQPRTERAHTFQAESGALGSLTTPHRQAVGPQASLLISLSLGLPPQHEGLKQTS